MYPDEHECWNASHYPGTRQLCCECEEPTGRCEEDSLFVETESSERSQVVRPRLAKQRVKVGQANSGDRIGRGGREC